MLGPWRRMPPLIDYTKPFKSFKREVMARGLANELNERHPVTVRWWLPFARMQLAQRILKEKIGASYTRGIGITKEEDLD